MKNRVLIIGLDGATLDLVKPWVEEGNLPTIKKFMESGNFSKLESVLPVLSSSAWASFMTGVNPGKHGLFDFVKRKHHAYELEPTSGANIRFQTMWKVLSEQGKKSIIINVPMTYPPENICGYIVTGLGTPNNKVFTHPPELSDKLLKKGYKVNKELYFVEGNENKLLEEIYSSTCKLTEVAKELIRDEWDLFTIVFRDTDEVGHFFWKNMDKSHPKHKPNLSNKYSNAILEYYKFIDKQISEIVSEVDEQTTIIIMSDHGQGPLYKDVYLNNWLKYQNFLEYNDHENIKDNLLKRFGLTRENISKFLRKYHLSNIEELLKRILQNKISILPKHDRPDLHNKINWEKTKAYSYGYHGQIYLNLKGREPKGIVNKEDYDKVIDEIISKLKRLKDPEDGFPVVDKALRREECFWGDNIVDSPDITVIMRDFSYITRQGYELNNSDNFFSNPATGESGSHRLNGLIIFYNKNAEKNKVKNAKIMDIFPTVLYLLNCQIPDNLDGEILEVAIEPDRAPVYFPTKSLSTPSTNYLTDEENEELKERLRNLGYLK